ncbi:polysaccharide deacetylase family protein [Marinobacter sp. 1Y8]
MMFSFAVLLVIAAYLSWRYAWWLPAQDYLAPRILMYHMISDAPKGAKFKGLRVSPAQFERQLQHLSQQGWHFVTMQELTDQTANGTLQQKTVALTFDDGYQDNFTNALPLLQKYNTKATLYLVLDRHDRDWSTYKKAHHNSGELARELKLTDEQVHDMLACGLIELGGHTFTHANLLAADGTSRQHEIADSRRALEAQFETPVTSFAYPFGLYGEKDVVAAQAAGYQNAVTTIEGIEDQFLQRPFELRRVKVSGKDNLLAFKLKMRRGIRGVR